LALSDPDTATSDLALTGTSTNDKLVSGITFATVDGQEVATVELLPGASGTATITITATEGSNSVSQSFNLTVTPLDNKPVLGDIADQTADEDTTKQVTLVVSDSDTALADLHFTGTSDNASLVSGVTFATVGTDEVATISLVPHAFGNANVTISVNDAANTVSKTFKLTVNSVDDAPQIGPVADQTTGEGQAVSFVIPVSDPDNAIADLTFTGSGSDKTLVTGVTFAVSGNTVTGTVTVAPGKTGSAIITINANDGTKQAATSFNLTVIPGTVATAPVLSVARHGNVITLSITGDKGTDVVVEQSSDLKAWTVLKTVTLDANGAGSVDVDTTSNSKSFFRAHN